MNERVSAVPRYSQKVVYEPTQVGKLSEVPYRLTTGLPEGEDLYASEDGYVVQLDDFSCAVASLINAAWAIRAEVPDEMYCDLYQEAKTVGPVTNEPGMPLASVHDIVNSYPESGIEAKLPDKDRTLRPLFDTSPEDQEEAIMQSARYIFDTIENKNSLVVSLVFPNGNCHAVALVGYSIDRDGYMLVQYIDSCGRPNLIPLEYVLLYLQPDVYDSEYPPVIEISYDQNRKVERSIG